MERILDPREAPPQSYLEADFDTPCPEPPGGWRAPDPLRATQEDQNQVFVAAERLRGYAGSWVDDRGKQEQDPRRVVVNVAVTRDVLGAERALRKLWGGSLCVSRAQHTQADLLRIVEQLESRPGFLSGGVGRDQVECLVVFDDGTLQRELNRRYGKDVVRVGSALRPYRG